ncbi:unnamed protein product [Boreogadus saida]
MDDERLVVEVEKYVELYDQSSRHYKDNSKKVIAWRAIVLEIGSSGDFLHLYCSAAVAPPPVGARGVLLTRVKCAPCRCAGVAFGVNAQCASSSAASGTDKRNRISTGTEVGLPEEVHENDSVEVSESTEVILTLMDSECDSRTLPTAIIIPSPAKKKKHISLQEELLELVSSSSLSLCSLHLKELQIYAELLGFTQ